MRRDSIIVGWVALPVIMSCLAMLGYACDLTIGMWHAPVALSLDLFLVCVMAREFKCKAVLWTFGGIVLSVLLSGVFVLYTSADAEAYHRPAVVLLANGWNPLQQTEVAEIGTFMGGGFRPWHVAFLPRMGWIVGAILYRWVGFVEVADALNLLLLMASILSVRQLLNDWGVKTWQWLWTTLICISPVVANGVWGGMADSAWYSAFLIAVSAAQRRQECLLSLAVVVMSGLKFTGVVIGALICIVYGIGWLVVAGRGKRMRMVFRIGMLGMVMVALILLINASPYLTSWKHHGGPFYPSHSFVASERFLEEKNPITNDFTAMNDDARELGYFGRLTWGYLSQDLCKAYYRYKTGRENFNPDFQVNNGVGGFGMVFRICFVMSLIVWPFIRHRAINVLMGLILLSVLIQPTTYSGYARYVPQFYLFPLLALMGCCHRFGWWRTGGVVAGVYGTIMLIYPLSFLALQWIISIQNLTIFTEVEEGNGLFAFAPHLASRHTLSDLSSGNLRYVWKSEQQGKGSPYSPYFGFYTCYLKSDVKDFPNLHHQVGNNDAKIKASRNASLVRYFLKDFLPRELVRIPQRCVQLTRLRVRQLAFATLW